MNFIIILAGISIYFLYKKKAITKENYLYTIKQTLKFKSKIKNEEFKLYLLVLIALYGFSILLRGITGLQIFMNIFLVHLIPLVSLLSRKLVKVLNSKTGNDFLKKINNNKYTKKIRKNILGSKKLTKNKTYALLGFLAVIIFSIISLFSSGTRTYNIGMEEQVLINLCDAGNLLEMSGSNTTRNYVDTVLKGRLQLGNSTKEEYKEQKRWFNSECIYYYD